VNTRGIDSRLRANWVEGEKEKKKRKEDNPRRIMGVQHGRADGKDKDKGRGNRSGGTRGEGSAE